MTADKILDASAFVAIAFVEPGAAEVAGRIRGCVVHAPLLLPYEAAHACLKKIRAHPEKRDALLSRFVAAQASPVRYHAVATMAVLELAERLNLSAYDASYLWLARRLECELVTLDARLQKAAAKS